MNIKDKIRRLSEIRLAILETRATVDMANEQLAKLDAQWNDVGAEVVSELKRLGVLGDDHGWEGRALNFLARLVELPAGPAAAAPPATEPAKPKRPANAKK